MDPFEALLRATIADLSYKGSGFRIEKDGIGLWFLQVQFIAPDVATGETQVFGGRKWRLSMHMTQSEIVQTALKAVLTAEEHEARELFLYRGRPVFGPHVNVERLWELAGDPDGQERRA